MSTELTRRIISVIAATQDLPAEAVSVDSSLEELGIDSLDSINIIFALEDEFDIVIPNDPRHIRSVGEIVSAIEQERD